MNIDDIVISLYNVFSANLNATLIACAVLVFVYIIIKASNSSSHSRSSKERYAMQKGAAGESAVSSILSRLPKSRYKVINDVLIVKESGSAQIDHVVVSPYGIFVIETKNYSGCLVGDEFDEYVNYYVGEKRLNIYNPLKQNRTHVYALMSALGISAKSPFIPILALSNDCQFEITSKTDIVHFSSLLHTIRQHDTVVFSPKDVEEIEKRIKEKNIQNRKERVKHIERAMKYSK